MLAGQRRDSAHRKKERLNEKEDEATPILLDNSKSSWIEGGGCLIPSIFIFLSGLLFFSALQIETDELLTGGEYSVYSKCAKQTNGGKYKCGGYVLE